MTKVNVLDVVKFCMEYLIRKILCRARCVYLEKI